MDCSKMFHKYDDPKGTATSSSIFFNNFSSYPALEDNLTSHLQSEAFLSCRKATDPKEDLSEKYISNKKGN